MPRLRVGIDASNLRSGGGITHLVQILRNGDPAAHGIARVVVWGSAALLAELPSRPWLESVHEPKLDRGLMTRIAWQAFVRPRRVRAACDIFFTPGATPSFRFHPFVSMSRDLLPFTPRERDRYRFSRAWLRMVLLRASMIRTFRHSDAVIYLTELARETIGHVTGSNGTVIRHGIDDRFRCAPRPARPLESYSMSDPFRFVYVSTIHLYKHQWNVADAVARLRRAGLPVALDLIGPSYAPAMERLHQTLAQIDDRDAVRIIGAVAHDQLPAILHRADAFVFASTCENLPNSLLEAMAAGLPIAASNVRPLPDILGDAGAYFDAESISSIESTLRGIASSVELRSALAHDAFARSSHYSWSRCADATFALLAHAGNRMTA